MCETDFTDVAVILEEVLIVMVADTNIVLDTFKREVCFICLKMGVAPTEVP